MKYDENVVLKNDNSKICTHIFLKIRRDLVPHSFLHDFQTLSLVPTRIVGWTIGNVICGEK